MNAYLIPVGSGSPAAGVGGNVALVPPVQPPAEGDALRADEVVALDAVDQLGEAVLGLLLGTLHRLGVLLTLARARVPGKLHEELP